MNTFHLRISSADGDLFNGQAAMLSLRGADGDLAVMAGHIPFVTSVQPGKCSVLLDDGQQRTGRTEGGLLTVSSDLVTLLSGSFAWDAESSPRSSR